jgi:oligoendopeptidase F
MASWSDIERNMSKLEELDGQTLESFARVAPLPSSNPTYHQTYESAMRRIQRRLQQFDAEVRSSQKRRDDEHWYKKPVGIVILGVALVR